MPLLDAKPPCAAYFPVILYVPVEVGVNVTEQLAEVPLPERVHLVGLNVPARLLLNLTFPAGVIGVPPPVSVTVAVQVVGDPEVTELGLQATAVEVGRRVGKLSTLLLRKSATHRFPPESIVMP